VSRVMRARGSVVIASFLGVQGALPARKPRHDRLCWLSQKCAQKRYCIQCLKAREPEYIPLATHTLKALEIDRRDLTNRVTTSWVCAISMKADDGGLWNTEKGRLGKEVRIRLPRRIGEIFYARRNRLDKSALVGTLKKRRIDESQDKAFSKPRNIGSSLSSCRLEKHRLIKSLGVQVNERMGIAHIAHIP
jgi:hypothetical protein